ncbi:hypothetical protein RYX36_035320, partial [Vicia faba]
YCCCCTIDKKKWYSGSCKRITDVDLRALLKVAQMEYVKARLRGYAKTCITVSELVRNKGFVLVSFPEIAIKSIDSKTISVEYVCA